MKYLDMILSNLDCLNSQSQIDPLTYYAPIFLCRKILSVLPAKRSKSMRGLDYYKVNKAHYINSFFKGESTNCLHPSLQQADGAESYIILEGLAAKFFALTGDKPRRDLILASNYEAKFHLKHVLKGKIEFSKAGCRFHCIAVSMHFL